MAKPSWLSFYFNVIFFLLALEDTETHTTPKTVTLKSGLMDRQTNITAYTRQTTHIGGRVMDLCRTIRQQIAIHHLTCVQQLVDGK